MAPHKANFTEFTFRDGAALILKMLKRGFEKGIYLSSAQLKLPTVFAGEGNKKKI